MFPQDENKLYKDASDGSVVHPDVPEQVGHGLPVVDAADGLRQDQADVHRFDLWTLELLQLVGDGVGHHNLGGGGDVSQNGAELVDDAERTSGSAHAHLVDGRLLDEPGGLGGQEAMRCHDKDLVGPPLLQRLCCCHEAVHVIDDVVLPSKGHVLDLRGVLEPAATGFQSNSPR